MQTVMPSLGRCFLQLFGGPLDGERWEVLRDEPDEWPPTLFLAVDPADDEWGVRAFYDLVREPDGRIYYRYSKSLKPSADGSKWVEVDHAN
jgi:hypothetical protein